jgi:DNA polymerase-3 subunit delta'
LAGTDYRVDDIRDLNLAVQRRPLEASRIVAIIPEAQRLVGAAPALLKTLEEPPPTTIFILLADDLPQGMATIRSRCGEVPFAALSDSAVAQWLVGQGIDSTVAAVAAEGAAGDTERALLLTEDEGFAARLERWREIPSLLDGSGVTAVGLAVELQQSLTDACAPLVEAQARELRELEEEAAAMGERGLPGRKDLLDHHKRQIRRYERTELRAGLGVLARVYRDRMVAATARDDASEIRRCASAIDAISAMTMSLKRNPRPLLNLEHLLLALPS